jgi:hypothetical protein
MFKKLKDFHALIWDLIAIAGALRLIGRLFKVDNK